MGEPETITIREWEPEIFHRRVLELEAAGYVALLNSYQISAEMNPETGEIIHLRSVDMYRAPARSANENLSHSGS